MIRTPNHLGDLVMALPAIRSLVALGASEIHGPRWIADLAPDLAAHASLPHTVARGTPAAVLFAPSLGAAWSCRRATQRIGTPTDGRGWLLTHRVRPGIHRRDTYRAIAEAAGGTPAGPPTIAAAEGPIPDVVDGHVGLNPVVTDPTRCWPGFGALADRLDHPVVFYGGPGESAAVAAVARAHPRCVGASLPDFVRALGRCRVFVSNDSGAAHVARAVGIPVVVVYGSTAPAGTGPTGSVAVRGSAGTCVPCYRSRCVWGDGPVPRCLDASVEAVLAAIEGTLGG